MLSLPPKSAGARRVMGEPFSRPEISVKRYVSPETRLAVKAPLPEMPGAANEKSRSVLACSFIDVADMPSTAHK